MTYAGDLTSVQAYEALQADSTSVLVDVRTSEEWDSVGVPDVPGVVFAEWTRPDGSPDRAFLDQLAAAEISPDCAIYFLCRSGQRSRAAAQAATAAGYRRSYNVSDGFEGPPDPSGRRTVSGWKNRRLPWRSGR